MFLAIFFAIVGLAVMSHVAPFPFILDAAYGNLTVWRMPAQPSDKVVYLTFDDGPNPTTTPDLLDLLQEKKVHATFFVIDDHVNAHTGSIVRRTFRDGHAVGIHSGDRWLMAKSPTGLANRLKEAADRIEAHSGQRPCALFRPHAGWRSVSMMKGLSKIGHKLAGWSWFAWDWVWFRKRTGERVASQILSHAAPGKIIVMHDGDHKNPRADRRYAVDATARIIEELRSRGYRFARLCDPALRAPDVPAVQP